MKLYLRQLVSARESLQQFGGEKLPVKLAYRIQRNLRKINNELQDFEEARLELVRKYGKQNEKGFMEVVPENMEAFNADLKTLLDEEVDVDIQSIPIQDLADVQTKEGLPNAVAPLLLMNLDFMFDGEVAK